MKYRFQLYLTELQVDMCEMDTWLTAFRIGSGFVGEVGVVGSVWWGLVKQIFFIHVRIFLPVWWRGAWWVFAPRPCGRVRPAGARDQPQHPGSKYFCANWVKTEIF